MLRPRLDKPGGGFAFTYCGPELSSDRRPISALPNGARTEMSMRIDTRAKAKKVPRQPSAARLARAEAEDRLDAEWGEQCLRALNKLAKEHGLPWFEALLAMKRTPLSKRPPGFEERRQYCNRCSQRISMSDEFDALYCRRCNRWIESKCADPHCPYCSRRPARPMP